MTFSIAIPAFRAQFLAEAIASCLAQTYSDLEVVVVDDASPDDLRRVVNQFDDPRVRYQRNARGCGAERVVDNWNIALRACRGDYVICMGDDDRLLPHCLADYAGLIRRHPGLEVYHIGAELIDVQGQVLTRCNPRPEWESALSLLWHRWTSRSFQFLGDFCYDRRALLAAGGYVWLPLAWGSDDLTAVRAAASRGIASAPGPGFQYRVQPRSISSSGDAGLKLRAVGEEQAWVEAYLARCAASLSDDQTDGMAPRRSVGGGQIDGEAPQSIDDGRMREADCALLALLQSHVADHYRQKRVDTVWADMQGRPGRVAYWLRVAPRCGISRRAVLRAWVSQLARSLHLRPAHPDFDAQR